MSDQRRAAAGGEDPPILPSGEGDRALLRFVIMTSCAIPERREVEWRVEVTAAVRESVEVLFARQKTLEDVVRWGLAQAPVRLVEDVVVQDEYTHDVVMRHPSGVFLVYDAT